MKRWRFFFGLEPRLLLFKTLSYSSSTLRKLIIGNPLSLSGGPPKALLLGGGGGGGAPAAAAIFATDSSGGSGGSGGDGGGGGGGGLKGRGKR
jgi:hypothetical protein